MILCPPPILMLVTEASERRDEIVNEATLGGVDIVQFRDAAQAWIARSRHSKAMAGSVMSVVAFYNRASGTRRLENCVQLPEIAKMPARDLRDGFGHTVVGRSVHSVERANWAAEDGADYVVAGTIYPSQSHPGAPGQGVKFLRAVCEAVAPLPVIAIGGITPERVGACIAAGAAGVAVLSPIMRATDPRAVAQAYRIELDKAWSLRLTENR